MLSSEVATGRRMNSAEICIFGPDGPSSLVPGRALQAQFLEGSKPSFGFKNRLPYGLPTRMTSPFGRRPSSPEFSHDLGSGEHHFRSASR
jgi:hypothetical protein